jgi:hypothetical protein
VPELLGDLDANRDSLPNYGKRCRAGLPISTAFAESAVNEVVAKRMNKNQQMRWNRYTVQPSLTVPMHVLNGTLEEAFRALHRSFRAGPPCAGIQAHADRRSHPVRPRRQGDPNIFASLRWLSSALGCQL